MNTATLLIVMLSIALVLFYGSIHIKYYPNLLEKILVFIMALLALIISINYLFFREITLWHKDLEIDKP